MSKFNIGDKVVSKRYPYLGEELGVIVGIDTRENAFGKYLVKFDSLELSEGLSYRDFVNNIINNTYCITEPYDGYAIWLEEEDLTKVEEECEEKCEEDKHEEDIKMEFDKIREQKKEVIKEISEKVLEMNLEIKEMEHEIEKIKKEWHL